MTELYQLNLPFFDLGWPAAAAVAYSCAVAAFIIPVCLGVNVVMLVGGDVQTLKRKLDEKGVTNIPHFGPFYRFSALKEMGQDPDAAAASCPVCEEVFDRRFTHLPIYGLSDEQLKYMADSILEAVKEMQEGR